MQFSSKYSLFALISLALTVPIIAGCGGGGSTAVNSPGTTPVTSNPVTTTPTTPVTPPAPPVTTPTTPTQTIPAGELIPDPFFAKAPVGTSTYDLFDGWQVAPGYPYATIIAAGGGKVLAGVSSAPTFGVTQPLPLTPGQLYSVTVVAEATKSAGSLQIDFGNDLCLNTIPGDDQPHTYTFIHQAAASSEPITISRGGDGVQISEVSVVLAPLGTAVPSLGELVQDPTFAQITPGVYSTNGPMLPPDGWQLGGDDTDFPGSPTIIGSDGNQHYVLEDVDHQTSEIYLATPLTTVPGQEYIIKISASASSNAQQAVLFYSFGTTEVAGTESLVADGGVHTFTVIAQATESNTLLTIKAGGRSNLPPGAAGQIKLYKVSVAPLQQASASARRKK